MHCGISLNYSVHSESVTHEKVEISLMQILSAGVIVMVALVLPAQQLYTEQLASQNTTSSPAVLANSNTFTSQTVASSAVVATDTTAATGISETQRLGSQVNATGQVNAIQTTPRVAGASTTARLITIPLINVTLDLSNQSQLLYLTGGGLIIFSILVLFVATEPKRQEMRLPPHWR